MHSLISKTGLVAASVALVTAAWAPTADAKTVVVNDDSDSNVGSCAVAGSCTLRAAISEAVATPGRDVIVFDPTVFPPAGLARIGVESPLPVIADPAGTVIDGTGAGVEIGSDIPPTGDDSTAPDGLVFASAPDLPLRDAAVINVTVSGFQGSGIIFCGGEHFACNADVVAPVARRVNTRWNGTYGLAMMGQNVAKARIEESAAVENASVGFLINGFGTIAGTRITRSVARGNDYVGILVGILTDAISDLAITDTSAIGGSGGIVATAFDRASKLVLTNVTVSGTEEAGIYVSTGLLSGLSASNVIASRNAYQGMYVGSDRIEGLVLKDVVTNANAYGLHVDGEEVIGAKITEVTAAGNSLNGITLRELTGAKISKVTSVGNGVQGLVLRGTGNTLKGARVAENIGEGIRLAGPGGGNTLTGVSATANQVAGIYVDADNVGNTLKKNVALATDAIDLYDANPSCGTNVWKSNVFERRNDPCIR